MIKKIILKTIQLGKKILFGGGATKHIFNKYKQHVAIENSTIMLEGSSININHKTPEKRKYVTIGKKGINRVSFVFESEKGEVIIGDNVHLGGVTFISRNKIIVKDDVTMAWDITIYDHNSHSLYWDERNKDNETCYSDYHNYERNNVVTKNWSVVHNSPIVIESKVWVGFGVLILKGVTIGEGAVIGAKSVVTKDVPAWSVVAGNPAKVVKIIPENKRN